VSGIRLTEVDDATIATPPAGKLTLFADDTSHEPSYKDDAGAVHSLVGETGDPAPALTYLDKGNVGSTETVDVTDADIQRLVADAATVTLTLTGWPASGTPAIVRLWLEQDGTGGRDWAFPAEVDFGDPGEPDWTTRAGGAVDLVDLTTVDGGTTVIATVAGREGPQGPPGEDGADGAGSGTVHTVEEIDGSPTDSVTEEIHFPNGTLDITAHVATFNPVDLWLPWNFHIDPAQDPDATVGEWELVAHAQPGAAPFFPNGGVGITNGLTSPAQNDEIAWDVILAAGTWTIALWLRKSTNVGIYTVEIDGSSVGTLDGYNASALAARMALTGVSVAATGKKRFSLAMLTKNASSSGYVGDVKLITFRRTA
jgi:hypothetical protein